MSAGEFVCGGVPTEHDRQVIGQFRAALAQPTEDQQRTALLELSTPAPERTVTLAGWRLVTRAEAMRRGDYLYRGGGSSSDAGEYWVRS